MRTRIIFLLVSFAAWLVVFALQKPVFLFYHCGGGCALSDLWPVMVNGLKLDSVVAGYFTTAVWLCTLLSVWIPGGWLRKFLRGYFPVMAVITAAVFAVDVALYSYWNFRIDATLLFYLQSPQEAMASVPLGLFVTQFFLFALYAGGMCLLFHRFILPLAPGGCMVKKRITASGALLLLGGLLFIAIRGGVTTSTANVGMVYFSKNHFLNHAAINPVFSLAASSFKQQDFGKQFQFFPEKKREALIRTLHAPGDSTKRTAEKMELLTTRRPHILLILLESFSSNVMGMSNQEANVTPHLDRLSREGVFFTGIHANSFRTDRGIVSVLNGYPAQPTTSIMKYPGKSQSLPSIARSLTKYGYTADMLYGGDINFTNMQGYFFSSGYGKITADSYFPISSRLNKWGANDDITFRHLYQTIAQRPADHPWFTTFLTLSSHEPFEVPYQKFENPYLNTVAFTDSCLGTFVEKIKTLPVWDRLLLILVSDHGYSYPPGVRIEEPLRYHIPMLWLGGAVKEPRMIGTIAAQTDLAKTLLNQLEMPTDDFVFSNDILSPTAPGYAFYTFNNGFGLVDSTGVSVYDNESRQPLIQQPPVGSEQRIEKGKALLQTLYQDLGRR